MSLKKITENKRDFSIEKIASAIHAENLISSLKNKKHFSAEKCLYLSQFFVNFDIQAL